MHAAVADSCISKEIRIFLNFCTATFCCSCTHQMQLVWINLYGRLNLPLWYHQSSPFGIGDCETSQHTILKIFLHFFQFVSTTAYRKRVFITWSSICEYPSSNLLTHPFLLFGRALIRQSWNWQSSTNRMYLLPYLYLSKQGFIISALTSIFPSFQRNGWRAVRRHRRQGVLLRGRRLPLHPADPGECQPLPHERGRAQRFEAGKFASGEQAEGGRRQAGRLRAGHWGSGRTASLVW